MKDITFALAALLLFPTVALAEAEDSLPAGINLEDAKDDIIITPDQHQLDSQIDDTPADHSELNNIERPANAADPVIIEPKFDVGSELPNETDSSINPYRPDPEPAPGIVIRIPTN